MSAGNSNGMAVVVASGLLVVGSAVVLARQRVSNKRYRKKEEEARQRRRNAADKVTLQVEGMVCNSCANAVQKAILKVSGVIEATVSYKQNSAIVLVESGTNPESLSRAVTDSGFEAKILEQMPKHGVDTIQLSIKGMMCQANCATTVQNCLSKIPQVIDANVSFPKKSAIVVVERGFDPKRLVLAVEEIGFETMITKTNRPKIGLLKKKQSKKLRHACIRQVVDNKSLEKAFKGILESYHEQQLEEYSRYKNWTQSCYMECHETWSPQVPITESLRDSLKPLLDSCKEKFAEFYKKLHGLEEVEVITLNSFVTKYLPVEGKSEFGKHVDSAKADGSLILALPTDDPHDWPGLIVWDGKDADGNTREQTYKLSPGDICCLDTLIWHHGLPITKGKRYVAVCFYRCKWKKISC